jgi:hypothetical protein
MERLVAPDEFWIELRAGVSVQNSSGATKRSISNTSCGQGVASIP